MGPAMAM